MPLAAGEACPAALSERRELSDRQDESYIAHYKQRSRAECLASIVFCAI